MTPSSSSSTPRWLIPAIVGAVLVAAAILAIVLSGAGSGAPNPSGSSAAAPSDASTVAPSTEPDASAAAGGAPVVEGTPLPPYTGPENDPAIGMTIPTVTSPTASITLDGTAKMLLFVAHWCPHCQAEVPVVQAWLDAGGLPDDVELISISTGIAPDRPNYPPEEWLAREGWTPPVITDSTGSVAAAYGLSAYPFWVFVNADGTVVGRLSGELTPEQLDQLVAVTAP